MADIYGAITDSAINRAIKFLMIWRPALFNFVAPSQYPVFDGNGYFTASENTVATRLVVTYPDPRENTKDRPRPAPVYASFKRRRFDPEVFTLEPGEGVVIATKRCSPLYPHP